MKLSSLLDPVVATEGSDKTRKGFTDRQIGALPTKLALENLLNRLRKKTYAGEMIVLETCYRQTVLCADSSYSLRCRQSHPRKTRSTGWR